MGGVSFILAVESESKREPVVMSDDFQLKYVGVVAGIIGGVVLVLGFIGLYLNLS